ncbi:MAG: hypothetical protein J0H32_13410 [Rhizobiales bacterium]|nr:hypothetical protein [Hyphomicrobiales bacterium]
MPARQHLAAFAVGLVERCELRVGLSYCVLGLLQSVAGDDIVAQGTVGIVAAVGRDVERLAA